MTRHPFAPAAQSMGDDIRDDIPALAQKRILENVWCGHCRAGRRIEDFTVVPDRDGIRLQGFCAVCGHVVVRLLELESVPARPAIPIRPAAAPTSTPKRAKPDGRKKLSLTRDQVELIIERTLIDDDLLRMLHKSLLTDDVVAVRGTLDDFDELAGYVAAEANHTKDTNLRKQLDEISDAIEALLSPARR